MTKAVILLADHLPVGLSANIAAVLGMSLGRHRLELVGPDVSTLDGVNAPGITTIPIPILSASEQKLAAIWFLSADAKIDLAIPFTDAALKTKNYDDYTKRMASIASIETAVHGLLLCGDRSVVNGLVGNLPLLK